LATSANYEDNYPAKKTTLKYIIATLNDT